MKRWLERLFGRPTPRKQMTDKDAAEVALRVFPKCC